MQIILVCLGLVLAASPFYPDEIILKMNEVQPYGFHFLLGLVLLMLLSRTVLGMRVNKNQLSEIEVLTKARESQKQEIASFKEKLEIAETKRQAAEQEKEKFQGAFRASQPQIDGLKSQIEALKKGQASGSSAASLLALLQEKGRFLDFVMEDAAHVPDEPFAAAARVVHQGCQEVIKKHLDVGPVSDKEEGASLDLVADYDTSQFRLVGKTQGEGPYSGVLRHKGWQATSIDLPKARRPESGVTVFAQAQVEIGS